METFKEDATVRVSIFFNSAVTQLATYLPATGILLFLSVISARM